MLLELYIRLFRTGTLAEYPVMSASQGAYVQIKQTSEATRETYKEYSCFLPICSLHFRWFYSFDCTYW